MIADPSMLHLWVTYAVILAAIVSYALDRIPMELTSLAVLGVLLVFFHFFPLPNAAGANQLPPTELLKGFADPALIAIVSLLVVGQALIQTGALEKPVRHLVSLGAGRAGLVMVVALIAVMVISAFLNNTPVVVIFIPVMGALAERMGHSVSRIMMPLSLVAILGGMTTLIGSSTNLLVAGTMQSLGEGSIGFFDFTVPGLVLAAVGFLYVLLVAPRILPERDSPVGDLIGGTGKQFITQMEVGADNPLKGQRPVAGMFPALPNMTVRSIQRNGETLLPPFDDVELQEGDVVVVAATRKALTDLFSRNPAVITSGFEPGEEQEQRSETESIPGSDRILAEAVIAPASRMEGRTIEQTGFRSQTRCIVFGIQRRSRMYRSGINDIRLEAGDVLLVLGRREDVLDLRRNRDVLLLEWSAEELPALTHAGTAIAIFGSVVLLAATDIMPIAVAAFGGAGLMIATGCLNIRQAGRAVDRRIVTIVAAALAMGTALQATGGAAYLAHLLTVALDGAPVAVLLSGYFLLVAALTNMLTNNATAVLFTPIALNLANEVGVPPAVFLYATIFAANCSFATPMSYQTNLLVMGPGHYRFSDFMRAGIPLVILIWVVFSLFAPWYFGL